MTRLIRRPYRTIAILLFTMGVLLNTLSCDLFNNENETHDISIVIGRGYDVTTRYAYSPDIREAVLDFNALFNNGLIKKDNNLQEGNFDTKSGSTITEYQSNLTISASASASVGIPGAGFSAEVGTGDGEINSKSGGSTNWDLMISLNKDGQNLRAEIVYNVKEMQGDFSHLRLIDANRAIKVNRNIQTIDSSTSYFTSGTIRGQMHGWYAVDVSDCDFLSLLYIQIDGPGSDENNIMVYGIWNIDISYR